MQEIAVPMPMGSAGVADGGSSVHDAAADDRHAPCEDGVNGVVRDPDGDAQHHLPFYFLE